MRCTILFLIFAVLMLASCHKESVSLPHFSAAYLPILTDPTSICFTDSLHGVLTAGVSWDHGEIFSSSDGGMHWQLDTAVRNVVESVTADKNGQLYACGLEGLALVRQLGHTNWDIFRTDYCWNRSCFFPNNRYGVIVSAEGYVRVFGPDYFWRQDILFQFPAELDAICFSDSQTVYAVGMGWVLRSPDAGRSWTRLPVTGDYFRSICFPDANTGYICGYSGTLLKSTDGGSHWQTIRKGGALGKRCQPFRAIRFNNAEIGYVVGENGIFWQTTDGGSHWRPVDGAPLDADFTDLFLLDGQGWAIAKGGRIFSWKE